MVRIVERVGRAVNDSYPHCRGTQRILPVLSTAPVPGYSGGASGTVSVNGAAPRPIDVSFVADKVPVTGFAAISAPEWAGIGIILVVIVVASVFFLRRRAPSPRGYS